MITMGLKFKSLIGYSDHTAGFETAIAAIALGANVIEKHITISKKLMMLLKKQSLIQNSK